MNNNLKAMINVIAASPAEISDIAEAIQAVINIAISQHQPPQQPPQPEQQPPQQINLDIKNDKINITKAARKLRVQRKKLINFLEDNAWISRPSWNNKIVATEAVEQQRLMVNITGHAYFTQLGIEHIKTKFGG